MTNIKSKLFVNILIWTKIKYDSDWCYDFIEMKSGFYNNFVWRRYEKDIQT